MKEMILVKARKLGGSIVVRIPKDVVDEEDIKPGQSVKITVETIKKDGFGIFKDHPLKFTKEDEWDDEK